MTDAEPSERLANLTRKLGGNPEGSQYPVTRAEWMPSSRPVVLEKPLAGDRDALLARLRYLAEVFERDAEVAHGTADDALLDFIDDPEVRAAYEAVPKWYA